MQRHLIVGDAVASLNFALDSSLRLSRQLCRMGHEVYWTEPHTLSWASSERVGHCTCVLLKFGEDIKPMMGEPAQTNLERFDAIHMRKDPPFDMEYVMATIMLDSVPVSTRQFNTPAGLRAINEKIATLLFPNDCLPSLVSADVQQLTEYVVAQCQGEAIVKPLDLFGGRGIRRISSSDAKVVAAALREETQQGRLLRQVQPFQQAVFQGEVRCFAVGGETVAWAVKQPAPGEFLANTRMGAKIASYRPTAGEQERASDVAHRLRAYGIEIVGFDLIGGFISEINVTSPRMLTATPEEESRGYQRYGELVVQLTGEAPLG